MNFSKFTSNKKILNGFVILVYTTKFVAELCPKFDYVGPKKIQSGHKYFFKDKKIIKFLKMIYNNFFFFRLGWSGCPRLNVKPPVL